MAKASLTLDLRSYSGETRVPRHDYHQPVMPVAATLSMTFDGLDGEVSTSGLALGSAARTMGLPARNRNESLRHFDKDSLPCMSIEFNS